MQHIAHCNRPAVNAYPARERKAAAEAGTAARRSRHSRRRSRQSRRRSPLVVGKGRDKWHLSFEKRRDKWAGRGQPLIGEPDELVAVS